jgi:hypothetical protein
MNEKESFGRLLVKAAERTVESSKRFCGVESASSSCQRHLSSILEIIREFQSPMGACPGNISHVEDVSHAFALIILTACRVAQCAARYLVRTLCTMFAFKMKHDTLPRARENVQYL